MQQSNAGRSGGVQFEIAAEIPLEQNDGHRQSLAALDRSACASRGGIQCRSSQLATDPLGRTQRWRHILLGLLFKSQTVIGLISLRRLRML
jgi:hypothetical protein